MKWTPTRYHSGRWSIEFSGPMNEWFCYRQSNGKDFTSGAMLGPFKTMEAAIVAVEAKEEYDRVKGIETSASPKGRAQA